MRHSEQRAAQHRRHKQATAAAATKALDPRVASGPEMDARMKAGARREEEDDAEEQARPKAEADRVVIAAANVMGLFSAPSQDPLLCRKSASYGT